MKHEGLRHCSGIVVVREVGRCRLNKNSFVNKICKELNALCEIQTQCVPYVVFTKHRSEALNPMILPLTSKDLQDIIRLIVI